MEQHDVVEQIRDAFGEGEIPTLFTEHEPSQCWQCAEAEPEFKSLARKLRDGNVLVRNPGSDLLLLNAEGFKFLAPYLAEFAIAGLPESDELMTDFVEWYGLKGLENYRTSFDMQQVSALKDFATFALSAKRAVFESYGFEPTEIEELGKRWSGIHA